MEFLTVLKDSDLIKVVERFSLKFSNILEAPEHQQLRLFHFSAKLAGIEVPERGFRLRTEISDDDIMRIVEIVPNAESQVQSNRKRSGVLLSLDCIHEIKNNDFWSTFDEQLETLHYDLKQLFFGIITQETLDKLRPIYAIDSDS